MQQLQQLSPNEPRRVVIEQVYPEIDGGRHPVKRVVGELLVLEANIFADGHDQIAAWCEWRAEGDAWQRTPMTPLGNDRWRAELSAPRAGMFRYRITGWVDPYRTWRAKIDALSGAAAEISWVDWAEGVDSIVLAADALEHEDPAGARALAKWADRVAGADVDPEQLYELDALMDRAVVPHHPAEYPEDREGLLLWVDRPQALASAWYELFPRSAGFEPGVPGTFADVERRLEYVAQMGFDVLYLPPVHPIGERFRKGRDNTPGAGPGEPGSPWAIGSAKGGHTAIHPSLGTMADFDRLVKKAREAGLEVAMDLAYQCSPDHPWVREHPEWFRTRADGSIRYAENPPKKYQDIYPFDFESEDWPSLWEALADVVEFWIGRSVRWFRVDNPHTKSLRFWEWLLDRVHRRHPEVIFLAEAFTRPAVMQYLAKIGFAQSYTYFTWRNTAWELRQYLEELNRPPVADYFRPNFWPNTPDILPQALKTGGRAAHIVRLVLAATLSASYGIYGPVFELMESRGRDDGGEEYADSEKYRIAHWDWDRADSLADLIASVNRMRRAHPALLQNRRLMFHPVDNDQLLAYSKSSPDGGDRVLTVVNLDFHYRQSGFVTLPVSDWGMDAAQAYEVHDGLTGARYRWEGPRNYVELDPAKLPAHIFTIHPHLSTWASA